MYRVLLIEDEQQLLENIAENLRFDDFEVYTASNGWEGVKLALEHVPDVVVCDLMMPELDGYGVLLELRSHPTTNQIPFLFLTARADIEDVRFGMNLGADDYLTKPCRQEDLVNAIMARMQKHEKSAGHYERTLNILEDVLAKEHESSSLKTRFLSMVSHDLRTGLTSILSSEQLLKNYEGKMTAERRQVYFNRIERNVHQMLTMLDDLLMVGENEMGQVRLQLETFNIDSLCQEVAQELVHLYADTHHAVVEVADNMLTRIEADRRYLTRILSNLVSNAIKYSDEGTTIFLHIQPAEDDDHIELIIQDEGIGIPQNDLESLFDLYKRAGNVGGVRGQGIGLAVVKQAIDLHKGSIDVYSEENLGTTFRITLPRKQPQPQVEQAAS